MPGYFSPWETTAAHVDCLVVDAVLRNRSPRANSLLTGKRTGILAVFGPPIRNLPRIIMRYQSVRAKFPKQRNRELIRGISELVEP